MTKADEPELILRQAYLVALGLHRFQVDKVGKPYIDHLSGVGKRLATMFENVTDDERDAAWLHDTLEDTGASPEDLLAMYIKQSVVDLVQILTRPEGMDYLDWIRSIAAIGNVSAIRVKLADLADNMDTKRVAALGDDSLVRKRYEPARAILLDALQKEDPMTSNKPMRG